MSNFADDQGMVSSSEDGLQRLNETANMFNMKINVQKTKTMVVSRDEGQVVNITIGCQRVEQVKNFKYVGSNISEDGYNLVDVKTRIVLTKEAFNKRKEFLTKGRTKQNAKKENGIGIGVASSVVWLPDMDVEKRK